MAKEMHTHKETGSFFGLMPDRYVTHVVEDNKIIGTGEAYDRRESRERARDDAEENELNDD